MTLNFTVENLNITHQSSSENPVNDSTNYLTAHFTFTGSPWDKATIKTAVFHQLNKAYSVMLTGDSCYIPFEVLKNGGFAVGITTSYEENGTLKTVYTKACIVNTSPSCYSESFNNPELTPSQYEQIMGSLNSGVTSFVYNPENKELIISSSRAVVYDEKTKNLTIGG